jgi:hypothetical protein
VAEPETAPPTTPAEEAPAAEPAAPETPTYLTLDEAKTLIEQTFVEREGNLRKDLDAAYKTLRRGEAKSDVAQKRIDKLEAELFEISLRGMEPQQAEVEKLRRQMQRESEARSVDPNAEVASFNAESASILEEEGISAEDPVLKASFQRFAAGWTSAADLRVALTRAIAQVHKEREKAAKADSAKAVERAREEERAKARNDKRDADGKIDRGTHAAASAKPAVRNWLSASNEEWEALKTQRGLRR